jgi:hypothetical protein
MAEKRLLGIAGGTRQPTSSELVVPPEDEMAKMGWDKLYALRLQARGDTAKQMQIAPYEHRAYARETVADNLALAPAFAVMPAAYQAAKIVRATDTDEMSTPPSFKQMAHGVRGTMEGVADGAKRKWNEITQ